MAQDFKMLTTESSLSAGTFATCLSSLISCQLWTFHCQVKRMPQNNEPQKDKNIEIVNHGQDLKHTFSQWEPTCPCVSVEYILSKFASCRNTDAVSVDLMQTRNMKNNFTFVGKFSDDTAILSLLHKDTSQAAYYYDDFVQWCEANHLVLNVVKTKKMVLEPRSVGDHSPVVIHNTHINQVCSFTWTTPSAGSCGKFVFLSTAETIFLTQACMVSTRGLCFYFIRLY